VEHILDEEFRQYAEFQEKITPDHAALQEIYSEIYDTIRS